jgi:hypothetical protein
MEQPGFVFLKRGLPMNFLAFGTALVMPIILYLLSPFIGGAFGFSNLSPLARAFIAGNTVYILAVFALTWAFNVAPQYAGPAANVGSVAGVMITVMIMSGKQPTFELATVMVALAVVAVWAFYALGRAPVA